MRYYSIVLGGASASSFVPVPGADINGAQFTSVCNGQNDPGALRVQIYIDSVQQHQAAPGSFVRIWGISLQQISQSNNLNGTPIEVYGGMWPGLPLANEQSQYRGLLLCGTIQSAFGNWEGTNMSLDLLITPGPPGTNSTASSSGSGGTSGAAPSAAPSRLLTRRTRHYPTARGQPLPGSAAPSPIPLDVFDIASSSGLAGFTNIFNSIASSFGGGGWGATPVNLIHNMQPNQPLSSAIKQTLSAAFPGASTSVNVSPSLKLNYQDAGFHESLQQYAGYINQLSQSILGTSGYQGVKIWASGCGLKVSDGTQGGFNTINLNYFDLIGQPTWISPTEINIKSIMRSDIEIGDTVTLPANTPVAIALSPGPGAGAFTSGQGLNSLTLGFTGSFKVTHVWHIGDSRHPDGAQWCTVIQAASSQAIDLQIGAAAKNAAATAVYEPGGSNTPATAPSRLLNRQLRRYR